MSPKYSWPPALPPPQPLVKQDSLDTYNERDPFKNDDARDEEEDPEDADSGIEGEVDPLDRDVIIQPPPPPPPLRPPTERVNFPKGLPWAPKVRSVAQFCNKHPLGVSKCLTPMITEWITYTHGCQLVINPLIFTRLVRKIAAKQGLTSM